MPDRPLVAGVDTSTQSCKVVVCDAETGEVVRTGRASHPDGTEVDPRHWWDAWREASGDGILDGVSAIAVGGQQHGMVLLDEHGEVVRPALLWNDTRSAQAADDLVAELGAQAWADATGLVPVAATTVSKLRWMSTHEPDNLARARTCVLPHDWLTGRIRADGAAAPDDAWTTDGGDASGTGYWSAGTREYRPDLLRLATGTELRLGPDLLAAGTDADALARRVVAAGATRLLGDALLDRRLVAGIGNMWLAELLWHGRLSPWAAAGDVDLAALAGALGWAQAEMRRAVAGARPVRAVYRRAGRPCPRCRTRFYYRGLGDRNRTAYWCPACQVPGPAERAA